MFRRVLSIAISVQMVITMAAAVPAVPVHASEPVLPEEGTYVEGEVIVMFRSGAVKDTELSLEKAQDLDNIGEEFGETMEATGDAEEAARDAKSEAAILKDILGDSFEIRDSIAFDEDLTVALVTSDNFDTTTMIGKLSADDRIVSAEANYYREPQSYDYDYNYSLNDQLNVYNYQANSPLAHNEGGKDTSLRGNSSKTPLSTNSGSIQLTEEEKAKEVVVAVMDSGILAEHEDLKNMLWENPGDLGLEGEHGYNFYNNIPDTTGTYYHGTHVSGIIAAQADNGVGIAGTAAASGANVKIMMVSTGSAGEDYEANNTYKELGAFNYILKAKQRGVNIVASSNSWSDPGSASTIYDEIINKLGEEGIVTFVAAGNFRKDLDNNGTEVPPSGDSPYTVIVGAAGLDGAPAPFSNYGRRTVDVFAPGLNILSTVNYSCYFPNIYTREKRIDTTEYYGQFDGGMLLSQNSDATTSVTPSKGDTDDSVKGFGASVFHAQSSEYEYGGEGGIPGGTKATYELTAAENRIFTDSEAPASLKLTIHDPDPDEQYFFYFPYEKNPETTGENTMLSLYVMNSLEDGDTGYIVTGGDVLVDADGNCRLYRDGYGPQDAISAHNTDLDIHICQTPEKEESLVIGADELAESGLTAGIGICLTASGFDETTKPGDIHIYLDSIAVSRPDPEIPERSRITPVTSYDVESGTSMAAPACAGAYAAYAACHPPAEGQSGSDYALTNRAGFLSCVTRTDELRDLCSTGGYIDLTHMDEGDPAITDAVCSLEDGSLTIYGVNLSGGYTLRCQKLVDGSEIVLPSGDASGSAPGASGSASGDSSGNASGDSSGDMTVSFSEDGKSIVIRNAEELFGSYVEFLLCDGDTDAVRASGTFFLVKGFKQLEEVYRETHPSTSRQHERKLITDTEGRVLYGYEPETGVVLRYERGQFNILQNTDLREAALAFMMQENGFDEYDCEHNLRVTFKDETNAVYTGNRLYQFVDITYTQGSGTAADGEEQFHYLAALDYTADKPAWSFTEVDDFSGIFDPQLSEINFAAMNGKIYCFGPVYREDAGTQLTSSVYSYEIASGEWAREAEMPANLSESIITVKDDKLYVMLGGGYYNGSEVSLLSRKVYCYDGSEWTELSDIPFTGKYSGDAGERGSDGPPEEGAQALAVCAAVGNGFLFLNCTADGYGNAFVYEPGSGGCEPLYYTINEFKADLLDGQSAAETRDGVYYLYEYSDGVKNYCVLCLLPRSSGEYVSSYDGEPGPDPPDPEPGPAAAPAISVSSARLKAGSTLVLKVTGGTVKKWSSSDSKTASVSNGIVKALKKGEAVITAALDSGETLKCTVKVATSPSLDRKSVTVKKGKSVLVGIAGRAPGTDNDYKNTEIAKVTSEKDVSTINVKGLKKGKTTLKVRVNGVWLELAVVVE